MDRYEAEPEESRRGFWQKAPHERKAEVALAITAKYREREDEYQQAKAAGAEAWGLGGFAANLVLGMWVAWVAWECVVQSAAPSEPGEAVVEGEQAWEDGAY